MWRGFLVAGLFFAIVGAVVVLVVMGSASGCSGGYNCTPSTIGMSIGVLLVGLGFLMVVVAFGIRPARAPASVAPLPPLPSLAPAYSPIAPGAVVPPSGGGAVRRLGFPRLRRVVLIGIVLFFLGLLVTVAGYGEFFQGDWFNAGYATWNYPNGGAGVAIMAFGVLLWLSGLILVTAATWREPRVSPPAFPTAPASAYPPMAGPGGAPAFPPPPPPPYSPPYPAAPPPPYPPGAG